MTLLVLGVALWWAAHLFKRIAPAARAKMGEGGKGAVAIALVISIVMMVLGFRSAETIFVWAPPAWTIHANNLLVLIAIYMMSPAPKKGRLLNGMRHPMLTGFGLWAIAHLLVNGDLASMLMFGGLWAWSIVAKVMINRAEPEWAPGAAGSYAKDAMFLGASVILMGIIGYVHNLLGYWPFPG